MLEKNSDSNIYFMYALIFLCLSAVQSIAPAVPPTAPVGPYNDGFATNNFIDPLQSSVAVDGATTGRIATFDPDFADSELATVEKTKVSPKARIEHAANEIASGRRKLLSNHALQTDACGLLSTREADAVRDSVYNMSSAFDQIEDFLNTGTVTDEITEVINAIDDYKTFCDSLTIQLLAPRESHNSVTAELADYGEKTKELLALVSDLPIAADPAVEPILKQVQDEVAMFATECSPGVNAAMGAGPNHFLTAAALAAAGIGAGMAFR